MVDKKYKIVKKTEIIADKSPVVTSEKTEEHTYNGLDYKTETVVKYLVEITKKPVKVITTETLVFEPETEVIEEL
jgi:hypothetical protein